MTNVLGLEEALARAAALRAALDNDGVLGIPTDTLYGLAADPRSPEGVEAILAMKGRPADKAMPVLGASLAQLETLGVLVTPRQRTGLARLWPARVTVVLPLASPIAASASRATLAVRVPAHEALRRLLEVLGPVTATSANLAGEAPLTSAADVARVFGSRLAFVLDDGPSQTGLPSTLVDLTSGSPRVLRPGAVEWNPTLFE